MVSPINVRSLIDILSDMMTELLFAILANTWVVILAGDIVVNVSSTKNIFRRVANAGLRNSLRKQHRSRIGVIVNAWACSRIR